uniref:Retrotransposon gag domain-containing protein n=1 Tax=Moniliophthora roreri TaxID=221103 RepID=A0A0W0EVA2_MONRR
MIDDKKDEASKGPTPDPFLGKQSDTCRFLLDLELYFAMNPVKANTDEKKKMLLLSLVKGNTTEWKQRETMKLFPEDDNPKEKKKAAEETWSSFKQRFRNEWQPVNIVREAQMKIEQIKMTDRANEYVNRFCLIAMDTKYDNEALMKFFREGLLESLQNKIMLRTDGEPETLDEWYKLAIKYDNQYKLVMANRKKRELIKPKIARKEKEVMIMVKRLIKPFIGIFDETKELNTGILDKVEDDEVLIRSFIREEEDSNKVRINAKLSTSQVLAQAHEVKAKPLEELLPPYLSDYSDRFEKKKAE